MNYLFAIGSVLLVSLLSVIFAIPFLLKKKISEKTLLFLLSMSVGVLLSTVFMNLLPEAMLHEEEHMEINLEEDHEDLEHSDHPEEEIHSMKVALFLLIGFMVMFVLEKFVHHHHNKKCEGGHCHGHAYHLAPMNLIGDAVHNFIDGIVIAGAYAVNVTLGITATISIIFHEIPQEIADFGVLVYSGMSRKKAILYNLLSSLTAVFGLILGIVLIGRLEGFTEFIIPFAAGSFVYIAASNLVPQLHRHCKIKDSFLHILAIILGIVIIALVTLYGPGHVH